MEIGILSQRKRYSRVNFPGMLIYKDDGTDGQKFYTSAGKLWNGSRVLTLIHMGGGVFHPPLKVFLAVFFKDINYVPQTYLTFTNYLFATF